MVWDVVSEGEPRALQQGMDIMQVEAPSSSIVQKMLFSFTNTWIWNAS